MPRHRSNLEFFLYFSNISLSSRCRRTLSQINRPIPDSFFRRLSMNKTTSRSILALIACGAGWLSPAMAHANEAAVDGEITPVSAPLSGDIMRSTGKWVGKMTFPSEQSGAAKPIEHAGTPAVQFTPSTPEWKSMLNTASYFIPFVAPAVPNLGVSTQYGPPPRLSNPTPP